MITSGNNTKLKGLVLAGGKSERMGTDKGMINWHGKEHRYYLADLLQKFCSEVYISCRKDQVAEIDPHYKCIPDEEEARGPVGALLSAFHFDPQSAWLAVACDLPLLDDKTIEFLISHRNTEVVATTFKSPHDGLPEPLITIWEPRALGKLASISATISCPRKALLMSTIEILEPPRPSALVNANTEADRMTIKLTHEI